jgi:hypothetical protein
MSCLQIVNHKIERGIARNDLIPRIKIKCVPPRIS